MFSNALQQPKQQQQVQCVLEFLTTLSYRTNDLQGYLHNIACGVSQMLRSDWSIVTVSQGSTGKVLASSLGLGDGDHGFSLHGTLVGEVIHTRRILSIENAQRVEGARKLPEEYLAYLGVPLQTVGGDCIGTICSFFRHPRQFTAEEIRFAELFAERAATAIDNYQLYQQQQRYATELQQANERLRAEIAERQQAEAALRQSEARFRVLVENAADAFLLIEPTSGRIVDANRRASQMLGYTDEELLTLTATDIDVKFSAQELLILQQQLEANKTLQVESIHRRKDGSTFPVEASVVLFEMGDRLLELALVRDITDRKQAEQAKARLAEVGELAAMIVHEIRNPLTTVLMGLGAFQKMELSPGAQQRLTLALEEAERLKRLLNEILLYTRYQVLQVSEEIELNELITEMLDSIRAIPAAIGRQIEFFSRLSVAPIWGDRDKLKQVFINLVRNACEAVETGEVVTWSLETGKTAHRVCIHIHNGGVPIPPDVLGKLGSPFFTTKPTGNGLGLAIVKRIVEAHSGEFAIVSEPEQGTIVSIQLPLVCEGKAGG